MNKDEKEGKRGRRKGNQKLPKSDTETRTKKRRKKGGKKDEPWVGTAECAGPVLGTCTLALYSTLGSTYMVGPMGITTAKFLVPVCFYRGGYYRESECFYKGVAIAEFLEPVWCPYVTWLPCFICYPGLI